MNTEHTSENIFTYAKLLIDLFTKMFTKFIFRINKIGQKWKG